MSYTERLLYPSSPCHPGIVPATPTPTPKDPPPPPTPAADMVVAAVCEDEAGALVATNAREAPAVVARTGVAHTSSPHARRSPRHPGGIAPAVASRRRHGGTGVRGRGRLARLRRHHRFDDMGRAGGAVPACGLGAVRGGVAAAVGDRRAHRLQHHLPVRHQLHNADLRGPHRQPRALRGGHRPLRRVQLLLRLPPRDGQRAGDAVRAGVRCGPGGHAGRLHAAVVDRARRLSRAAHAAVRVRGAGAAAAGAGRRHRRRRGDVRGRHHPADVRAGRQLPHAEVPAGAEQGGRAGVDRARRAARARRAPRPVRVRARLGRRRGRARLRRLVVGRCRDGWTGLSRAAFTDLWAFIKLSLASAVMLCLEMWYMMLLVVLTGHLDDAEIAVDSIAICMNINGWEGMLFIGLSAAISVRVSNELGSGRPRASMYAVMVVLAQSLAFGLLAMALVLATREQFPAIFTGDRHLQKDTGR